MMYEEKAILVADEQVYVYVVRSVRYVVLDPTLSASCFKKHVYFGESIIGLLFVLWSVVSVKVLLVCQSVFVIIILAK